MMLSSRRGTAPIKLSSCLVRSLWCLDLRDFFGCATCCEDAEIVELAQGKYELAWEKWGKYELILTYDIMAVSAKGNVVHNDSFVHKNLVGMEGMGADLEI